MDQLDGYEGSEFFPEVERRVQQFPVLGGGKDGRRYGKVLEMGIQVCIGGDSRCYRVHRGARDKSGQ